MECHIYIYYYIHAYKIYCILYVCIYHMWNSAFSCIIDLKMERGKRLWDEHCDFCFSIMNVIHSSFIQWYYDALDNKTCPTVLPMEYMLSEIWNKLQNLNVFHW